MLKDLFNRTELVNLSGMRQQATYRIEERNILTPCDKQYTYNQVVFCRVLDQTRKVMGLKKLTFADGLGPRGQFEIEWDTAESVFFSEQGVSIIRHDPAISASMAALINEWLLPLDQEVFPLSSNDKNVRAFCLEHFRFLPKHDMTIAFVVLPRVREAIGRNAEEFGLFHKLARVRETKTLSPIY